MSPDELLREPGELGTSLGPAVRPSRTDELLPSLTETARRLFGAAACSLALQSEDDSELRYPIAAGEGAEAVTGMRVSSSSGIVGWVVQSGQPIGVSDLASDPRFSRELAEQTGYVPQAMLAVPVKTPQRMLGVTSLLDRDTPRPDAERGMELLSLFADQAALALASIDRFSALGLALLDAFAPEASRPVPRTNVPIDKDRAWGGAFGAGITAAVVDSGIDGAHPAVGAVDRAVVLQWDADHEEVSTEGSHDDLFGHGIACAGIIRRTAPDAAIWSVRVLGKRLRGQR